jgi:predicted kinase
VGGERPTVVLVTGAPGSGKTTLGVELSRALQIPFLARDDVRRGLFFTNGAWTDRPGRLPTAEEAVEAFLRILEATTALGVSCIVEYVVRKERPADLERIAAAGDCVVVLTDCHDPLARVARRDRADLLVNRAPVLGALGYATAEDQAAAALARMRSLAGRMRTEFDLPALAVRTDDGYDPGLDAILAFVTDQAPD